MIHKNILYCEIIDPSSAYISKELSSSMKPIFFVTCGLGTAARNVFFSESNIWLSRAEVESEKTHPGFDNR